MKTCVAKASRQQAKRADLGYSSDYSNGRQSLSRNYMLKTGVWMRFPYQHSLYMAESIRSYMLQSVERCERMRRDEVIRPWSDFFS